MSNPLPIDKQALTDFLFGLLNTPSPTGFTERAIAYTQKAFEPFPFKMRVTPKGMLVGEWAGQAATAPRALTAHVDTLGAMVKEIKGNGRLKVTKLGGYSYNTVEGEGCTVFTAAGQTVRGTFLLNNASVHVYSDVNDVKRGEDTMEVRLDERTTSVSETAALGIQVGDFVAWDPRVELTPTGFIRSRHLDDKAGVASIFGAVKALVDAGLQPAQRTTIHITNYEEVGHGAAAGFPADLVELVSVDMAAIGEGQASDEFHATLCVKDSGGPYSIELRRKFEQLAQAVNLPLIRDIYPHYGSDGEAYWFAGGDVRVALIGPGVDASHNYERTHTDALVHTAQILAEYLRSD